MNPMKKVILLIFALLIYSINGICSTAVSIYAITKANENNKIDLSGNFPTTGTRSLFEPIILMQYSSYLEATFYSNLGTITIEIKDNEDNIIFRDSINTNDQKQYQILTSNYYEGIFYIEFRNFQGQYMRGNFLITK